MGILFIPILLVIMYLLILRPQQKRMKEQRAMLSVLDVGDDVRTDSGIYGTISDLDGDTVFLMVADGVEIKISKASIAEMIQYDDED
ncbi:MAG: preprotein translocase subunit YajC [Acidimicrobiaceae bacterium]|jgi:preprotein translocase subunit YajC|nr:preprotein translocase subunit YajC [Acidimicrobiaceae bacterium]MBF82581.1 preprotein translocase subunit YajC [Actinomycetota bacterium]HAY51341.1 preprotein translocase subunit YajC [Acidimicrobiaceae bacterium]|tara:strand:- start:1503 stop:1763 length:261 start_codon:yes stop_codon:yes gene_type:complete